jgi:hypothetical protein
MTKSKVDTKALEEVNGTSAPQTSDNLGGTAIFKMAHDALELLVTCFGTNDQAAERLAGQFCSSTNFLLNGSEKFDGATRRALDAQANVVKFEEQVKDAVAGSSTRLARAKYMQDLFEAEERDLRALHKICMQVFKDETGKDWQPYKKAEPKAQTTAAERLAQKGIKIVA